MLTEEIDESLFISRFEDYDRVGDDKNFSYKGLRALYNFLIELYTEEEPFKLDVIGLCCDFAEYEDLNEYLKDHGTELKKEDYENEEDFKQAVEEEINDKTTLIKIGNDLDDGFIIHRY